MFNTNASLNTTPYIIRLYLEQKLFKDKFTVEAGKLDLNDWLDTSAVANSGDLQFFSDALVNNLSIPFPAKGAGALFNFRPYDWMYFATGAATADSVSTMVGLNNAFNSTFFISELGFSRTIAGRQGNYRLIFHLEHQKFVCFAGMDTDDETEKRNQAGYALSFDQALTDKLTLFARYGFANRKVRKIEHFISCGAQLDAFFTPLKYDYIGFGYALSLMSSDWRAYNGEDTASTESIYELYWNLWPNSFVSVTPDVQVALHPKADRSERVVVTCGMRVLVAF
jgi:carbohydrate-selective porin OprB